MLLQTWITLCWLLVLGAIIGSFLNVVVYRLPRGLSLVSPGSQCPNCNHAIRWHDNVPILGWLWLRGHCRDCGTPISIRYPLVELAVGLMFLSLGRIDVAQPLNQATKAATQQATEPAADATAPEINTEQVAPFVVHLAFHLLLLCPLLAAALIDADGQNLPRQLITWPAAVGILIAIFLPPVQAFPLWHATSETAAGLCAFATAFVGMLIAVVMRLAVLNQMGLQRPRELGLWNSTLAIYAVGAFLGWPAVLVIGSVANIWAIVKPAASSTNWLTRIQPTAIVFFGALVWCFVERPLAAWVHSW